MADGRASVTAVEEALLRYPAAARYLNISERTLAELVKTGEIDVVRIGTSVRFSRRALDAYVEANEGK